MELKHAWIVVEGRDTYGDWMRISWEVLNAAGQVVVSSTVAVPPTTGEIKIGRTNGDGSVAVECVKPQDIRIGVDSGGDAGPFLPHRVFVMGAGDESGPLVMASVLDWPASTPLEQGMIMVTLDSVGGVTPERDDCGPAPGNPGKPGPPELDHG